MALRHDQIISKPKRKSTKKTKGKIMKKLTTYNGKIWKNKTKSIVNEIKKRGWKFFFHYHGNITYAIVSKPIPDSCPEMLHSRGTASCHLDFDHYCPPVGRYYALKRAFEAALRLKTTKNSEYDVVLNNEELTITMTKKAYN